MNTSVLIVGAGPVGLTMAAELARYGVAVRIIDKATGAYGQVESAGSVEPHAGLLDRAGAGPVRGGRA